MAEEPKSAGPGGVKCPVCGRRADIPRLRPFCSARCADVDLGRWFTGAYALPAPPDDEDGTPQA